MLLDMKRRNTESKDAVLALLESSKKAMSHDAIERQLNMEIDRASIYRILNRFCEDDIVHKIVADDGKQYFAVCRKCTDMTVPDNHFHFRCTGCQTIECLPVPVNYLIPKQYKVERVNCVLIGLCKDCAKR